MRHPFLESIAGALAERKIATLRYQFPYMEQNRGRPDPPSVAEEAVRGAVAAANGVGDGLPLLAGGKSFGGRMTSRAGSQSPLPNVRGLVFLGFPLHPPGRPGTERAAHLDTVSLPMLFLQGTRDTFARLELLQPLVQRLGPRATLRFIEGGDHSFAVTRRAPAEVMKELADAVARWADDLL
jgi:hypothetical protein